MAPETLERIEAVRTNWEEPAGVIARMWSPRVRLGDLPELISVCKKDVGALLAVIQELQEELSANTQMLAKQCDMAREAEAQLEIAQKRIAHLQDMSRIGHLPVLENDSAGDNLAIALCTYYKDHPSRPEDDEETEHGWGAWVEEKCNQMIARIAEKSE